MLIVCAVQEEAADKFRYVMWGSLDDPEQVPPKGEFFCKNRTGWMPELEGMAEATALQNCGRPRL